MIGETLQKRPLHLVKIGDPAPVTASQGRERPTVLFVCSQHGNEPAGREACLQLLRDLAFTEEAELVSQLQDMTLLFVPSANPDGRAANTRENSEGIDINRDHLNLLTLEAQAVAKVVRDWRPEVVLDLHEYGPSIPGAYDDELLVLWPRNLNADQRVHDMAHDLSIEYIEKGAEEQGYSTDEYGQYELADNDVHQSAGDGDEGIARNAMGLRHSVGILVESAVTQDPRNGPGEVTSEAEVQMRRVASHLVATHEVLRYLREKGVEVAATTDRSRRDKVKEGRKRSAPVYFGGADNQEPTPEQIVDPPPCGYELTDEQFDKVKRTMKLMGMRFKKRAGKIIVHMNQVNEPMIPLLLDARGTRHEVEGKPLDKCR